ncbi:MAG: long-chain acyl-CoA synthetase [Actinomycetota bacterium]|nr:long-chain acyl-CoA synthetase [Actinomycetota bacterium]
MDGIGGFAAATPDATALVMLGRQLTFGKLDSRQRRLVGALHAAGLKRRDRIAVLVSNRIEMLEVTTGVLRAGIVPVPINALLTPPEIAYVLEDSGARWLFTDRPIETDGVDRVVTFGDAYERVLHESTPAKVAPGALGRPMHYTSGTTGQPKGVWVNPAGPKDAAHLSRDFRSMWAIDTADVHLVCSPLAHSAPHRFSLRTLEAGGTVVVQPKFDARETLAAIEMFGVTSTFVVPTHLERILALGTRTLGTHDLSSLRLVAHAGAPIREETKRRSIDLFPYGSLWEFYGSTEGQATRISTEQWLHKPGSVGTPRAGARIDILDDDGTPVKPGEVGTVWVTDGSSERFEYWRDKKKTRAAWRGDAFSVGDLGYLDADGYLYLAGRKFDTIITGGVNVYPQEVEAVLSEHPAVAEVMVYGADHDEWGQEVRARVVAKFGEPLDPELLVRWARERLAGFKCPRAIEIVDDLPRTPTGKVLRRAVSNGQS